MAKGSKQKGRKNPAFGPEVDERFEDLSIGSIRLIKYLDKVSVSLRYYQRSCECFSHWTAQELKAFSLMIEKILGYTAAALLGKKNLCEMHKGKPGRSRFSYPDGISPDQTFWEIKVDQSNKLRIHGFFVAEVFFLVWLDREHECFPYHKH